MFKRLSFLAFLMLVLVVSLGAIHAGDVNATSIDGANGIPLELEDTAQLGDTGQDAAYDNAKNQTELVLQTPNVYYGGYCNVSLKDSNANASLADANVNVVAGNFKCSNMTNDKGISSIMLKLNPGTYNLTAYFEGDATHNAGNLTSKIKILPTIKAADVTKYYKGSQKYTATFFDAYGNPLVNAKVNISVKGKSYTKTTNNKGIISQDVNLKPGNYKIVATDPITGYKLTTNFKILSTIAASNLKKVKGDDRKFSAKFLKSNGKALTGKQVKIKINGKTYKYKTNSKGKVKLSFNSFKKGKYNVVCYNKDGLSKSSVVKVYKVATTKISVNVNNYHTFAPKDAKEIRIKLSTALGGDSNAGKTIKITLNKQAYYRNTDANGVIVFKLPVNKGFLNMNYQYAGNQFFKSSKLTNYLTVLDTNVTSLTVNGLKSFGYGAGSQFKVAFSAGGVPLAKKTVTFNIEGKSYAKTTDNNGIASLVINQNIGNYTISYSAPTDSKVNGTSGSCVIEVFKRAQPKLVWKSESTYSDGMQTFKILLKDNAGKPISARNVWLTIMDQTYIEKTDANGYATIWTSVPVGKYQISLKFSGDNDYLPASASKSIKVKISKFASGLNVKDKGSYPIQYRQSTSHCQVNNAKIKALVDSLTSGLTDNVDKAKAIFNYVRDNIEYDYYYDSKYGALGTLNLKKGNCVDQSHLLIAMYRTAGFNARYVHGSCDFGVHWYGHVWTQVLVDNIWMVGDPISYRNDLGKIRNWDWNTYSLHGRYVSLPF